MIHFAANYIFTGKSLLKNAFISVGDNGVINYISSENEALVERERMIFYNGIISPGFINSHCHLELSGLKDKVNVGNGLASFIDSVASVRKEFPDFNKQIELQDDFMWRNGIQAVADIVNTDITVEVKSKSKIFYYNFIEVYGVDNRIAEKRIVDALNLKQFYKDRKFSASIVPHAFYSLSSKLFEFFVDNNPDLFSMHFMESIQEKELYSEKKGLLFNALSSIFNNYSQNIDISNLSMYISKFSDNSKRKILVHNVEIENTDDYNSEDTFYCLCPRSNLKIHNKLPREEFVYSDYNFVVGTDSLASNDSLCILSELKCLMNSFPKLTIDKVLKWATFNGACAINKEDTFGWFSKGMAPGIILLENMDLQNLKLTENTRISRLI